ncbi:hypothetical protein R1flu_011728 [Riccia fluitans]|uniref:Uncharacterized protein n=1 Tax=Riccia fluitans TaxID=41844 RepID=A0ABD1Z8L9_9MARC
MENSAGSVRGYRRRRSHLQMNKTEAVQVKHQRMAKTDSVCETSCKSHVNGWIAGTVKFEEDHHTCILSYEGLHIISSHKQLEPILLENHWRPVTLCKYAGWREYHYYKPKSSSIEEDVLLKKVRLQEPIEDAPKQDILKFVRNVNETANRNILCSWVHNGPKIAPSFPSAKKLWWRWTTGNKRA